MEMPVVRKYMDKLYESSIVIENETYDVEDKLMELPFDDYKISCLKILDSERLFFSKICGDLNAIATLLVLYFEAEDEEERFKIQQMIRMYEKRLEAGDSTLQRLLAPNVKIMNRAKRPYHETMTRRLAEFIKMSRYALLDDLFYNRREE